MKTLRQRISSRRLTPAIALPVALSLALLVSVSRILAQSASGSEHWVGTWYTSPTVRLIDTNNRWPDHLARRFVKENIKMGVLNAGIGGNRLLRDENGVNALARFDRDVVAQPGVTLVVVLEGINDIGRDIGGAPPPSAAALIAAHQQLIDQAHGLGLKIYGATLTPFDGANYYTAEGEKMRQALNEWIRTRKKYDAVLDFDAVTRDPNKPTRFRPEFDSGDHLHPSAAGYRAMANMIDLALFKSGSRSTRASSRERGRSSAVH